jgi:hypothetical protein
LISSLHLNLLSSTRYAVDTIYYIYAFSSLQQQRKKEKKKKRKKEGDYSMTDQSAWGSSLYDLAIT